MCFLALGNRGVCARARNPDLTTMSNLKFHVMYARSDPTLSVVMPVQKLFTGPQRLALLS